MPATTSLENHRCLHDTSPGCIPLNRGIQMTEQCWDTDTVSPVPEASRCCLPAWADSSSGIACTHFESCRFDTFAHTLPRLLRPWQQTVHPTVIKTSEQRFEQQHLNLQASNTQKLKAPSLSSQHTFLCIKSTLYFCSSGTTKRINCPTVVANTSLANKLQKDSWGTKYRTWRSWGRPGKTQKVFRGL